ncbi:MAG: VOC family protein [Rhizobiaceae bacterium]
MTAKFEGGIDIAMKVPPHQYKAMIAFYRDVIGLRQIAGKAPAIGFELGPNKLWLDEAPGMSQAEIWLELFTDRFEAAAAHLAEMGVRRCDAIEPLPEGFRGGWITSPANIVHMVREPDAW